MKLSENIDRLREVHGEKLRVMYNSAMLPCENARWSEKKTPCGRRFVDCAVLGVTIRRELCTPGRCRFCVVPIRKMRNEIAEV